MARARLHLICGNCGCNDMWSYSINPEGNDLDGELVPAVFCTAEIALLCTILKIQRRTKIQISA